MSITTADQKDYAKRVTEYAEEDEKFLRDEYADAHFGLHDPNDQQFLAWFALMARGGVKPTTYNELISAGQTPEQAQASIAQMTASGQAWVVSLPLDDGKAGPRVLRRYEKLTGLDRAPNIPGIRPPTGVM